LVNRRTLLRRPLGRPGLLARRRGPGQARSEGQTLVEFALVFPIFIVVLMGVIEFAFYFNALLGISFASRDAALAGATAGANQNADCAILQNLETAVGSPINKASIQQVRVYRANKNGTEIAGVANVFVRSGTMSCTSFTGTPFTVPYTKTGSGYDWSIRCDTQAGCGGSPMDNIGVSIIYRYTWRSPLHALVPGIGGGSGGITFTRSNAMRMEPNN